MRRLICLGLVVCLIGCAEREDVTTSDSDRYQVVTTIGMIADIVRNVAGEHGQVRALIGEGIDPHLYNPTRSDVTRLMDADIVFYNGLKLEGKMTDVLERIGRDDRPVYAVTDLIDRAYLLEAADQSGYHDPHVWMDVTAWMEAVKAVKQALITFDPLNEAAYEQRADAYLIQLRQLDEYVRERIATVPESLRLLVTAHDAFNYFGRAYGVEVRGIQGLSTEAEAGLRDINRLVDWVVERAIPAIFVESSVSEKNVRALIEGAERKGHAVQVGGTLYSDAMGSQGTYEGTYIGMIDHNATTIVRALGGDAPAGGMQGRLAVSDEDAR